MVMELGILKKKPVLLGILFIISYTAIAQMSLILSFQNSNATPIWPPSGLAVALLFIFGLRFYPAIFFAAVLANIISFSGSEPVNFTIIKTSLVIGMGNTFEALIIYHFFKMATDHQNPLQNPISFLIYMSISIAACFGCAFLASFTLYQNGLIPTSIQSTVLITWWLGDLIGILTVGGFLISLKTSSQHSKGNQLEYILTLISLSIVSIIFFSNIDHNSFLSRLYFILLPLFIWITFRFSLTKILFSINLMAILATIGTANGKGPFQHDQINDSLLLMQCFIGAVTMTFALFKLQLCNQLETEEKLSEGNANLKAQWLSLLTFCVSLLLTVFVADNYAEKDKNRISLIVKNELDNSNNTLKYLINSKVNALKRLADRQAKYRNDLTKLWDEDIQSYISHSGILESLEFRDENGDILVNNLLSAKPSSDVYNLQISAKKKRFLKQNRQSNKISFSTPFTLNDNISRMLLKVPSLNKDGEIIGSVLAVLVYNKMMLEVFSDYTHAFNFEMQIAGKTTYRSSAELHTEFKEQQLDQLYNLSWVLVVSPTKENLALNQSNGWSYNILVGLLITLLVTTTIYQSIMAGSKAKDLQEMNKKLNTKNAELIKQKIASRQADQAKDSFLKNMSHELRTPMNGVLGALQLAKECSKDELPMYLKVIDSSAKSLLSIIDEILDYSNMESGEIIIETIDFKLSRIIDDSVKIIESAAAIKGLEVKLFISDLLPEYIQGDPVRLKQILLNLLSNALNFTEEGSITISVSEDFNETLKIEVKDTGVGIPEKEIKKVFNHFEQLDMSSTREIGGAGLGLSICRSLVNMMAGSINVISKENEGSTFIVKVPLIPGLKPLPKSSPNKLKLNSRKVLICEDNQTNSMIIKKMLEKLGIQVIIAEDGREALTTLVCEWEKLDLVLIDLQMPHLGGLEVAAVIKEQVPDFDVPIVALTADCSAEDKKQCELVGMQGFLSKPISKEKLEDEIDRLIKVA